MKLFVVAIVVVMMLVGQRPSAEPVLDLVGFRPTPDPASASSDVGHGTGRATGTSHERRQTLELKLELLEFQRVVFNPGDSLIYEVVVANVGTEPVTLPWSADRVRFATDGQRIDGIVGLEIRDATGKELLARLPAQALYGSRAVPDSLLTLLPSQRARIRVPATWRTSEVELGLMLAQPMGRVQVGALFQIKGQEIRSAGAPVTVLPRSF
jgi:hypothetical protein